MEKNFIDLLKEVENTFKAWYLPTEENLWSYVSRWRFGEKKEKIRNLDSSRTSRTPVLLMI